MATTVAGTSDVERSGDRTAPGPTGATRRVTLPAQARSCGVARQFVRAVLEEVGWAGDVEAAVQLSSELVAAIAAEAGSTCQVTLRIDGRRLRVEATESLPEATGLRRRADAPREEHRRLLLDTLSSAWGRAAGPSAGSAVWFELSADGWGARPREEAPRVPRYLGLEASCPGGRHLVCLAGELDVLGAGYLERVLDGLPGPVIVVDLGAVHFVDVAGLRALASAKWRAEARGQRLSVVNVRGTAKGLIGLLGMGEELG